MKIRPINRKTARIEMIPLIDVVFLLLVFFIYAMLSMVIHRGIPVDLPQSQSGFMDKKDYLSLTVTREGDIYLNKRRVPLRELKGILIKKKEENPFLKVFINGDKDTCYKKIIQVLDVLRIAGLNRVSLETEFEK